MFVVDDVSVEFKGSCQSLDDPFCHESTSDGHLLLKTVSSKVFAEQLTCKDAVSCIVLLCVGFSYWSVYNMYTKFYLDQLKNFKKLLTSGYIDTLGLKCLSLSINTSNYLDNLCLSNIVSDSLNREGLDALSDV